MQIFFLPLDDLSLKLSKTVIIYVQLFIINLAKSSQTSHRSCLLVSFCCQPSPGFHCCWFNAFLHRSALFLLLTISIAQQVHTCWLLFYLFGFHFTKFTLFQTVSCKTITRVKNPKLYKYFIQINSFDREEF